MFTGIRHFLKTLSLLALLGAPVVSCATETLRVLAWPGYADDDLVRIFERRTGARVEVTLVDSDEVLWQRVSQHQGADFDLFAVNTAELQRYIKSGLAVPVDTRKIPNLARQLPRFRNLKIIPGLVHGDKVFAIPYTYAEMGLIYDRTQFRTAPQSIDVLWDPRYKGKVIAYNGGVHAFSLAAQSLGWTDPFRIAAADWDKAVHRLIALRRNVLTFYNSPEQSVELFKDRSAALLFANYGSQQLQLLRKAGLDVGYAIPREGALAWLDCWAVTRGAKNAELAAAWIDFLLEAKTADALVTRQGLANTVSPSPFNRAEDRLVWLEPVEDAERRIKLWERIISGDSADKVLKP